MLGFLIENKDSLEILLKIVTLCFTAVTLVWTIQNGIRAIVSADNTKKDEQITKWMQLFAEDNRTKRLSAINGLSKNCSTVYNEIFLLCGNERDYFLKRFLEKALIKNAIWNIHEVIDFNKIYFECYIELVNRIPSKEGQPLILPESYLNILRKSIKDIRIQLELENKSIYPILNETIDINDVVEYILLSSKIMATSVRKKAVFEISNTMLFSASFYAQKLNFIFFHSCAFSYSIMRHMVLRKVNMKQSILYKCNFTDSYFKFVDDVENTWDDILFINSKQIHSIFKQSSFIKCDFSQSSFRISHYDNVLFKGCTFSSAAVYDTSFNACTFIECSHDRTRYDRTEFCNVKMFRNNIFCEFINCNLNEMKFGGSDFSSSSFNSCKITNTAFSGADLRDVKFCNCTFDVVSFLKVKNMNTVIFENCTGMPDNGIIIKPDIITEIRPESELESISDTDTQSSPPSDRKTDSSENS